MSVCDKLGPMVEDDYGGFERDFCLEQANHDGPCRWRRKSTPPREATRWEGVRFYNENGVPIAEIRVIAAHPKALAEVFRNDAPIILIGERLRVAGVVGVTGRHTTWRSDGKPFPDGRGEEP